MSDKFLIKCERVLKIQMRKFSGRDKRQAVSTHEKLFFSGMSLFVTGQAGIKKIITRKEFMLPESRELICICFKVGHKMLLKIH